MCHYFLVYGVNYFSGEDKIYIVNFRATPKRRSIKLQTANVFKTSANVLPNKNIDTKV